MYSSYIRPLSFDYRDAHEKEFQVEDIPAKFKQEDDDYQPRVRPRPVEVESEEEVVPYVPPPPHPPPPPVEPQPQLQPEPCCSCLTKKKDAPEICSKCMDMLCQKCIKNPIIVKKCAICKPYLCIKCKKNLGMKQDELKLRSYPIRFKDAITMHFLDCKCEHCKPSD